jgi:membrane-associated tyrosine/threonine-specific cdc2-inhibitory kinase
MDSFKTPGSMPRPVFYESQGQLSTKKARQGLKRVRPPKAPEKVLSAKLTSSSKKAAAISFRSQGDSLLASPFYNECTNDNYLNQCFVIESKIGSGDFGDVYRAISKEDGKQYAIKRTISRFRGLADRDRKLEEVRKNEVIEPHPNLVRFHRAWEENDRLYMQLEYCETNLEDYAYKNSDIPERVIWYFMVDLLQAVKHLHDHDFIHLDIKPENIFLSSNGECKLGDFGLAFDLKTQDLQTAVEGDGRYLAPELLTGRFTKPSECFTKAVDIFSLGMTMLELACDLDLSNIAMHDTIEQIRKGRIPKTCRRYISDNLFRFLSSMLNPDPNQRPTADDLLNSHYMKFKLCQRTSTLIVNKATRSAMDCLRGVFLWLWNLFVTLHVIWFKVKTPTRQVITRTPDGHLKQPINFQMEDTYSDDEFQSFCRGSKGSPTSSASFSLPPPVLPLKDSPDNFRVKNSSQNSSVAPQLGTTPLIIGSDSPSHHLSSTPIKLRTPRRTPMRLRSSNSSTPSCDGRPSFRRPPSSLPEDEESGTSSSLLPTLNNSELSNASTIEPRNLLMSFDAFSDSD